jgi:hypothetical protein
MANNFNDDGLKKKLAALAGVKVDVMKQVLPLFIKNTPINKGNARRNTKLINGVIEADYPYAEVLNEGRKKVGKKMQGSVQAPKGMVTPTKQEMDKLIHASAQKKGK